jgi:hypothetical protein
MESRRIPKNTNDLTAMLLVELPKAVPGLRCWRMSVGGAYPIASIQSVKAALMRGSAKDALDILKRTAPKMFGSPGLPDIDGILPDGRRFGIEVKWGKDRQSAEQSVCQKVYEDRGAVYVIAADMTAVAEVKRRALPAG